MSEPTDLPGVSEWPEPVTLERVAELAKGAGVTMESTENGRLRARVGENLIEVALTDDANKVLRILGLSGGTVAEDRINDLATFANNWHRERVWPTLLWTKGKDGQVNLRSVFTIDVTAGSSNSQLAMVVQTGLAASAKGLDTFRSAIADGITEPPPPSAPAADQQ